MAGFFLLNSSVQATNRGPARLEPDPARLMRLWADTAATKANRKPAIVGTVRHKANALFWNSIEPPLPIDISSQTPIAVHTMNRLVGPTSAGCSEGGVTVSFRNGTGEGSFPKWNHHFRSQSRRPQKRVGGYLGVASCSTASLTAQSAASDLPRACLFSPHIPLRLHLSDAQDGMRTSRDLVACCAAAIAKCGAGSARRAQPTRAQTLT